jgi:hypothetical protein
MYLYGKILENSKITALTAIRSPRVVNSPLAVNTFHHGHGGLCLVEPAAQWQLPRETT